MQEQKLIEHPKIDIKEVFSRKNAALAKAIPNFVYSYLRKIIHENELNEAIEEYKDCIGFDFINFALKKFGIETTSINLENIPASGRFIIVSNHPFGGPDGLALMKEVGKIRKDIAIPVNDLMMYLPNLKELFIPLNKHGKNTENVEIINKTFESSKLIIIFPAGLVSRRQKHGIEDLDWKKTFLTKAILYERDIIPAFIYGRNSNFFYNLANLRKFFRIKSNIEMLYLVNEMFKKQGKPIKIKFGEPISYKIFDKSKSQNSWANEIKKHVYALGQDKPLPLPTIKL